MPATALLSTFSMPAQLPRADVATAVPLVLVVDDDRSVAAVVARLLTRGGFRSRVATSAAEALAIVSSASEAERPSVVLSDLRMPGMGGTGLHEALVEIAPDVALVFMTGYLAYEAERTGQVPEDHVVLVKPFTSDVLVEAISSVLRQARGQAAGLA